MFYAFVTRVFNHWTTTFSIRFGELWFQQLLQEVQTLLQRGLDTLRIWFPENLISTISTVTTFTEDWYHSELDPQLFPGQSSKYKATSIIIYLNRRSLLYCLRELYYNEPTNFTNSKQGIINSTICKIDKNWPNLWLLSPCLISLTEFGYHCNWCFISKDNCDFFVV